DLIVTGVQTCALPILPFSLLSFSYLHDLDARFHHALIDERGPVRHDLLRLRTPAREPGDAGWSVQNQGCDLAREALHRGLVGRRSEEHTSELQSRSDL